MHSLEHPGAIDELVARLGRLDPSSERQWGTLSPHEMLCHLADSCLVALGERPFVPAETFLQRTAVKWVALHTPVPWPKGVPTRPEVDPRRAGTRPDVFDRDRATVVALLRRMVTPTAMYGRHPTFGPLSRREWLRWGYAHTDHHLRQFGL